MIICISLSLHHHPAGPARLKMIICIYCDNICIFSWIIFCLFSDAFYFEVACHAASCLCRKVAQWETSKALLHVCWPFQFATVASSKRTAVKNIAEHDMILILRSKSTYMAGPRAKEKTLACLQGIIYFPKSDIELQKCPNHQCRWIVLRSFEAILSPLRHHELEQRLFSTARFPKNTWNPTSHWKKQAFQEMGVFTPKALKCPSGPAGAAARLVPREVDLYNHSHDGWLLGHCKHLELYFTKKMHEITQSRKMDFSWHSKLCEKHLILCDCTCRVKQSKSLRQQHKSSEALRFLYIYIPNNELAPTNHGPLDVRSHKSRSFQAKKLPGKGKGHANRTLTYSYSHYSTLVICITALIMTYHDQTIE